MLIGPIENCECGHGSHWHFDDSGNAEPKFSCKHVEGVEMCLVRMSGPLGEAYMCAECGTQCIVTKKDLEAMPKEWFDQFRRGEAVFNCACNRKQIE